MGARTDLNKIYVFGALGAAAIIGGLAGSWTVFAVAGAIFVAGSIYSGQVRRDRDGRW